MSTINAKKEIRQQAIKMLVTEDLSKWSHRHDVATIDALREANKREEAQSDAQRQSTGQLFSDWYDTLPYGEPSYQETFDAGFEHGASSQQVEAADARYKFALDEWMNKTEWVQKTSKPRELGMHRADILKARIEALEKGEQDEWHRGRAAGVEEYERLNAKLKSVQANETDSLLIFLGLDPNTYRTDGGWLNLPKIKAALKEPAMYPQIEADMNPAAWRKNHKGIIDKRHSYTDDPKDVARWAELGVILEPLYTAEIVAFARVVLAARDKS